MERRRDDHDAAFRTLVEQGDQQMQRFDLCVPGGRRLFLGGLQRFDGFDCQLLMAHMDPSLPA